MIDPVDIKLKLYEQDLMYYVEQKAAVERMITKLQELITKIKELQSLKDTATSETT